MEISVLLMFIIATLLFCIFWQRHRWNRILKRIERMLEEARYGRFQPNRMDEEKISFIENSMKLFLQDSLLSEENLQAQKDKIQTLISDISHQTITPLSNILIYSQLLEEELAGSPCREKARIVRMQAEKLDFLLQSLVKTSRLEAGIIKTKSETCDLNELMESVIAQSIQKARDKKVELIFNPQGDRIFALCDPKWTGEACFNIMDNAVKYTKEGGYVKASLTEYQMFVRIDVKDNGIGIAEEDIPKVFGRFYRADNVSGEEGVGLGLYVTREIVESQRGYVKVESQEGIGSCFSIFLPSVSVGREMYPKCDN